MLEILVVMVAIGVIVIAMAKGRKRRSMGRYLKGNIDLDVALGTLAGNTAVLQGTQDAVEERTLISSIDCIYSLADFTLGDNIGPIEVGVAHSDYTLAEIEEWLELSTGWAEGNLQSREVANRKIRRIGVFDHTVSGGDRTLNDGRAIKTKLNWILTTGQNLDFYFYNQGSAALATTDPNGHVVGHANLWPR